MLDIRPRTISKIEKELAPFAPFGLVAALALNYGIDLEDLTHDKWKQTNLEKSDARLGHALHKFRNLLTSEQRSAVINQIELFAMENKKAGAIVDYFALPKNVGN